jgi:hypothetical protein
MLRRIYILHKQNFGQQAYQKFVASLQVVSFRLFSYPCTLEIYNKSQSSFYTFCHDCISCLCSKMHLSKTLRWNQICDEIKAILVIVLFFRASVKWHFFKRCLGKRELHVCFQHRVLAGGVLGTKWWINYLHIFFICFQLFFQRFSLNWKYFIRLLKRISSWNTALFTDGHRHRENIVAIL